MALNQNALLHLELGLPEGQTAVTDVRVLALIHPRCRDKTSGDVLPRFPRVPS